jgi:hypothetical protein
MNSHARAESAPYREELDHVSVPRPGIWLQPDRSPPPGPVPATTAQKSKSPIQRPILATVEVLAWCAGINIMIACSFLW